MYMDKITNAILLEGPLYSQSGYGSRFRQLVTDVMSFAENIYVFPTKWGKTLNNVDFNTDKINLVDLANMPVEPDVYIQCTVPNEFKQVSAKSNIGITAGIESNLIPRSWVEKINSMDMVLVSSNHSKTSILNQEGVTNKNIKVLNEKVSVLNPLGDFMDMDGDFYYLCSGAWLPGAMGHDRKNIPYSVYTFLAAFMNHENPPGLIIKTDQGSYSNMERMRIRELTRNIVENFTATQNINSLPEIKIIHGQLSDQEMSNLIHQDNVKACFTMTHGEGFGRHLAEFLKTGKPIIAPKYSGLLDFVGGTKNGNYLINGKLDHINHTAANKYLIPESKWFYPDTEDTITGLTELYENYDNYYKLSKRANLKEYIRLSEDRLTTKLYQFIKSQCK